ncbi:MAG: hypothetical protein ABEK00_03580 [Candidatus Nanohaloarchaea archaeon]
MPENETLAYAFISILAATTGYLAYQRTGEIAAVFVIFAVSWILYQFTGLEKIWNFLGTFINPTVTAFLALLIGTSYFIMRGHFFTISIQFGVGIALLGAATGLVIAKYWEIAD